MRVEIDSAVVAWCRRGYCKEDVERVFKESLPTDLLLKLSWNRTGTIRIECKEQPKLYFPQIQEFLHEIAPSLVEAEGVLLLTLQDGCPHPFSRQVPVLTFGKNIDDEWSVLFPNPEFTGSAGHRDFVELSEYLRDQCPWEKRAPAAFWRGSSTGAPLTREGWRANRRIALACLSKDCNDLSMLDAGISKLVQVADELLRKEIMNAGVVKDEVPPYHFFCYKYLVEIDGNSCTWSSFFWKLASYSLMLKVESDKVQWFSSLFRPQIHYLPVKSDLTDLLDIVSWARKNDEESRSIAERAAQCVRCVTIEDARDYAQATISALLSAAK